MLNDVRMNMPVKVCWLISDSGNGCILAQHAHDVKDSTLTCRQAGLACSDRSFMGTGPRFALRPPTPCLNCLVSWLHLSPGGLGQCV